ncbi:MAG: hypothetical protein QM752_01770 [Gammaproteobacteria bacterium]
MKQPYETTDQEGIVKKQRLSGTTEKKIRQPEERLSPSSGLTFWSPTPHNTGQIETPHPESPKFSQFVSPNMIGLDDLPDLSLPGSPLAPSDPAEPNWSELDISFLPPCSSPTELKSTSGLPTEDDTTETETSSDSFNPEWQAPPCFDSVSNHHPISSNSYHVGHSINGLGNASHYFTYDG